MFRAEIGQNPVENSLDSALVKKSMVFFVFSRTNQVF